ncbi:histidinol dehydrogenase [Alkalilimnicola ehrlichii]|uniref:Histidinol dehydrogenase n=1 Tax=Alkalilimnicola ehrlichii TaxID=351052 RepID=A0A3E0X128_9GAMM|nr:histidinol dehydrogenase [Alkalilimnicola ehrlichii]RFA30299.1 histidinol dehydrogenase [Alkalilimnicola ehrlichii]RFA37877.1 histidinol dehydrogenase [Alkalilimnicola ehrlichii]
MVDIERLSTAEPNFWERLRAKTAWDNSAEAGVEHAVRDILHAVKQRGDAALLEFSQRFDQLEAQTVAEFEISAERLEAALAELPSDQRVALEQAAGRIRAYAERQKQESWQFQETDGTLLGQRVTPLDRVGVYVPGGKAAYPSSVLMNVIPAKVAGVPEVIMVVPTPAGEVNALVLAAARIAGADRVFTLGGAHAVGALAYGTATIPAVDKIVGPGNAFVAAAKRMVFGVVGIDMVAGPSEILVICDGETDPDWIAMDLFSQAEHDEQASAILIATSERYLDQVQASMERLLPTLEREAIIRQSLAGSSAFVLARDLSEAAVVANVIAPEHLELSVAEPEALLAEIRHAGAVFLGRHTPEALGDYCAGPNHVLPTSATARFASPLGVYDFQKRTSVINCSASGSARLGKTASILARGEGLTAHARSAELRVEAEK